SRSSAGASGGSSWRCVTERSSTFDVARQYVQITNGELATEGGKGAPQFGQTIRRGMASKSKRLPSGAEALTAKRLTPRRHTARYFSMDKPLAGKIAVVAGATRGAGRGIATALGEAGATVYCTGR